MMSRQFLILAAGACMTIFAGALHADERESLESLRQTTLQLIQLLVQQGVLTQDKADELLRQAQRPSPPAAAPVASSAPPDKPTGVPLIDFFGGCFDRVGIASAGMSAALHERKADSSEWRDRNENESIE